MISTVSESFTKGGIVGLSTRSFHKTNVLFLFQPKLKQTKSFFNKLLDKTYNKNHYSAQSRQQIAGIMKKFIFISLLVSCFHLLPGCGPASPVVTLDNQMLQKYQEAKLNYYNGDLEKAEKGFREITEKRGDFFQAHFMLGKTLFTQGKPAEAEKIFSTLVNKFPQYHEAEIWLARSELANNKADDASKRLQRLLAFDSSDPRLLSLYAKTSEVKNDTTTALQYFQLSAQFEEELALNHYEIARYYYQFGMTQKALLEIDKCLLLLPEGNTIRNSVTALKNTILDKNGEKNDKK
jgi:tetratricopeptide (TPR) repeat protein